MTHSSNNAYGWRMLLIIPIAVMAVLSIVATGGSSGGGGDDIIPQPPPTILTTYNFAIGSLINDMPLEAEVGGVFTATVNFGNTLRGSMDLNVSATNEVTLLRYVVNAGSTLNISVASIQEPALNGMFSVAVTEAMNAEIYDEPTSGVFEAVAGADTIAVRMTGTGVELSLNGGPATPYTWSEYSDLLDDPGAEDWQRAASLAGGILEFVFEYFTNAADIFDDLEVIAMNSPYDESCDMFTGSPPNGMPARGMGRITWQGSGELMSGHTFQWEFMNCWVGFGGNGELMNGMIQMSNYTETIDASNTLTRVGFEPSGGVNGGVEFLGFRIEETVENGGMHMIDPSSTVSVSGGFSVIFEAP